MKTYRIVVVFDVPAVDLSIAVTSINGYVRFAYPRPETTNDTPTIISATELGGDQSFEVLK